MTKINLKTQLIIGVILSFLLILTRGHHFASAVHMPGASWAVFFIAGIYLSTRWPLILFLGIAASLDFIAFKWGGIENFCHTPAYFFLLPAYCSLWLGGRYFIYHFQFNETKSIVGLVACGVSASLVCELFSSGGFYLFSGHFSDPTLLEFISRLVQYFPAYLGSLFFYVFLFALLHIAIVCLKSRGQEKNLLSSH